MAIESALSSDDFETAYSYVVNRLSSPTAPPTTNTSTSSTLKQSQPDPLAAHAALQAGKHPTPSTSNNNNNSFPLPRQIRRLDQRRDLLAHALLLSPPSQLPETLAAWRRCEEELLTLLASEAAAEREADDAADRGSVDMDMLPGTFGGGGAGVEDGGILSGRGQQSGRREVGRAAVEEAPMGLFEVARGAARALSRNTTTATAASASAHTRSSKASRRSSAGRGAGNRSGLNDNERYDDGGGGQEEEEEEEEGWEEGEERVRKRDVVASAVTGGFARGVGWVLGAAPVGGGGGGGDAGSHRPGGVGGERMRG